MKTRAEKPSHAGEYIAAGTLIIALGALAAAATDPTLALDFI